MSDEHVYRLAEQFDDARHEIDRLRAVNAKLRAALEKIVARNDSIIARNIAVAALKTEEEKTPELPPIYLDGKPYTIENGYLKDYPSKSAKP